MNIPAAGPKIRDFFGTPLAIGPSPGLLTSNAGLLPIRKELTDQTPAPLAFCPLAPSTWPELGALFARGAAGSPCPGRAQARAWAWPTVWRACAW